MAHNGCSWAAACDQRDGVLIKVAELFYEPGGPSPAPPGQTSGCSFGHPPCGRRSGATLRRGLRARPSPEPKEKGVETFPEAEASGEVALLPPIVRQGIARTLTSYRA